MRNIRFTKISAAFVVIGGLVLTGCSSNSAPAAAGSTSAVPSAPASAAAPSAPASSAPAASAPGSSAPVASASVSSAPNSTATDLQTTRSKLGTVIVDAKGFAVYYFKPDVAGSGKSTCSGACLTAWPAVVPATAKVTAKGISAKIGEITRTDGTKQITVNGRPVYLFQGDKAPADINGQDVKKVWFLVGPSGAQIGG